MVIDRFLRAPLAPKPDEAIELAGLLAKKEAVDLLRGYGLRVADKPGLIGLVERLYAVRQHARTSSLLLPGVDADRIVHDLVPRFLAMSPSFDEVKRFETPIAQRPGWRKNLAAQGDGNTHLIIVKLKERMLALAETNAQRYEAFAMPDYERRNSSASEKPTPFPDEQRGHHVRMLARARAELIKKAAVSFAGPLAAARDDKEYISAVGALIRCANTAVDRESAVYFKDHVVPAVVEATAERFLTFPKWRNKVWKLLREWNYPIPAVEKILLAAIAKHGTADDYLWAVAAPTFHRASSAPAPEPELEDGFLRKANPQQVARLLKRFPNYGLRKRAADAARSAEDFLAIYRGSRDDLEAGVSFFTLPGAREKAAEYVTLAGYPKGLVPLFEAATGAEFLARLTGIIVPPKLVKAVTRKFQSLGPSPADATKLVAMLPEAVLHLGDVRPPGPVQRGFARLCRWALAKKI